MYGFHQNLAICFHGSTDHPLTNIVPFALYVEETYLHIVALSSQGAADGFVAAECTFPTSTSRYMIPLAGVL